MSSKRFFYWVECEDNGIIPPKAIRGGIDSDGSVIYIGRAYHRNELIPAKVIPEKRYTAVPYKGREYPKKVFDVLCGAGVAWVRGDGNIIPTDAVKGGRAENGETLYIGRAYHKGSHTIGRVQPSQRCVQIPFEHKEIAYRDYEILVVHVEVTNDKKKKPVTSL